MIAQDEIIIYGSGDDYAFVAEVPELPDTHESALASLWIDAVRESGGGVPEPKGRRLVLA